MRRAPALLCLNLQQRHLDPMDQAFVPRGAAVLPTIRTCLTLARAIDLPVIHIQTLPRPGQDQAMRSIRGVEPWPVEPLIFKRGASFFASQETHQAIGAGEPAFVLGFTGSRDCTAAAVDADRVGTELVFIADAIASPIIENEDPETIDRILIGVLRQFARCITSRDLARISPKPAALPVFEV